MAYAFNRQVEVAQGACEAITTQYAALIVWRHALYNETRHGARSRPKRLDLPYAERTIPEDRVCPLEEFFNTLDGARAHIHRKIGRQNLMVGHAPPFGPIVYAPALLVSAELISLHHNEVWRQDELNLFFCLVKEIFHQRQERFIHWGRAHLMPLCLEKSQR